MLVLKIIAQMVAVAAAIVLVVVAVDWIVRSFRAWRDNAPGFRAVRRELADACEDLIALRRENRALAQSFARTLTERDRAREAKRVLRRRFRAAVDEARAWKGWATSHGWNREEWINAPRRAAKAVRAARGGRS